MPSAAERWRSVRGLKAPETGGAAQRWAAARGIQAPSPPSPPPPQPQQNLTVTNTAGRNVALTPAEADPGPDAGIMERAVHSPVGRSIVEFLQPIGDVEMMGAAPQAASVLPPPQTTGEAVARQGAKAAGAVTSAIVPSVPQLAGGALGSVVSRGAGGLGGMVAGVTGFAGGAQALRPSGPEETMRTRIRDILTAPKQMLSDVVTGPVKAGIEASQPGPMTPERVTAIGEELQPAIQAAAIPVGLHYSQPLMQRLLRGPKPVIDESAGQPDIRGELPAPAIIPPAGFEYGPPRPEFVEWFRGTYGRDPTPADVRKAMTPDPLRGSPRRSLPTPEREPVVTPPPPTEATPAVPREFGEWFRGTYGRDPTPAEIRAAAIPDPLRGSPRRALPAQPAIIPEAQPGQVAPKIERTSIETTGIVPPYVEARGRTVTEYAPQSLGEATPEQQAAIAKNPEAFRPPVQESTTSTPSEELTEQQRAFIEKRVQSLGSFEAVNKAYQSGSPVGDYAREVAGQMYELPSPQAGAAEPDRAAPPPMDVPNVPTAGVRNPAQERSVARGANVAPPARPMDAGVPPVVRNEGQPAGNQPGNVAGVTGAEKAAAPPTESPTARAAAPVVQTGQPPPAVQPPPAAAEVRAAKPPTEIASGKAEEKGTQGLLGPEAESAGVEAPQPTTPAISRTQRMRARLKGETDVTQQQRPPVVETGDRGDAGPAGEDSGGAPRAGQPGGRADAIVGGAERAGPAGAGVRVRARLKTLARKEIPSEKVQETAPADGGEPIVQEGGEGRPPVEARGQGAGSEGIGREGVPVQPEPGGASGAPAVKEHTVESAKAAIEKLRGLDETRRQTFLDEVEQYPDPPTLAEIVKEATAEAKPTSRRRPPPDMGGMPGMSLVSGSQVKETVSKAFDRTVRALGLEKATTRLTREAPKAGQEIRDRLRHYRAREARFGGLWSDELRDVLGGLKRDEANNAVLAFAQREKPTTPAARKAAAEMDGFDRRFRQAIRDAGVRMMDNTLFRGAQRYIPQLWRPEAIEQVKRGRGAYFDKALSFITDQFTTRRLKYVDGEVVEQAAGEKLSPETLKGQATRFLRDYRQSYYRRFMRPPKDRQAYDPEAVDFIVDAFQAFGKEYHEGKLIDNENPPPREQLRTQAIRFIREGKWIDDMSDASPDELLKAGVVRGVQLHRLFEWPREFLVDDLRQAWFDHIGQAAKVVARQSAFGTNARELSRAAERYIQEVGDTAAKSDRGLTPDEAMGQARTFIEQLTAGPRGRQDPRHIQFEASHPGLSKFLSFGRAASAFAQVGPGSAYSVGGNVILGLFTSAYRHGLLNSLRESGIKPSREVERAGGYRYEFVPDMIESSKLPKKAAALLSGWYRAQEAVIRSASGLAAARRAESLVARLNADRTIDPIDSRYGRELSDAGMSEAQILEAAKTGKLSPDLRNMIMRRGIQNSQPMSYPEELPHWWSGPVGRLMTQYWPAWYQTVQNTIGHSLREAGHGNLIPIARLLPLAVASGWAYRSLGDILNGRQPPKKERDKLARWFLIVTNPLGLDTPLTLFNPKFRGAVEQLMPAALSLADQLISGAVRTGDAVVRGDKKSATKSLRNTLRSFAAYRTGETLYKKAVGE